MSKGRQTDQTTKAVSCIVALLFSLAAIATWAATAPAPARYAVMMILRRAEAVACSYIYWELYDCGLTLQWALPHGCRQYSDPEDALMLGWWFRVLAVALRDLPRRAFFQKRRRSRFPAPRCSRGECQGEGRSLRASEGVGETGEWNCLKQRGPPICPDAIRSRFAPA